MKLINKVAANKVLREHSNDKLPIYVAYKIMKLLKSFEEDVKFYRTKINEIFDDCAEKDPNGRPLQSQNNVVIIQNGKSDEFNNRIKGLEEMEVEEKSGIKFTLDEFASVNISVNELTFLECYIQE